MAEEAKETKQKDEEVKKTVEDKSKEVAQSKVDADSRLFAMLSYFWVLSVIFYILKKENSFVKFHAAQGMVLFGASLLIWVFNIIPILGQIIFVFGWLAIFVLCVVGAVKAYQGEKYKLPVVSDIAEKINF